MNDGRNAKSPTLTLATASTEPLFFEPVDEPTSGALRLAEVLARRACRDHEGRERSSAASPPPRIAGYDIGRELGRGGQGTVYLARDGNLGRDVALKVLPWATGTANQERLRREAEITARLDLPEVCKIFEVGRFDGGTFVAMQPVSGVSLAARIRSAAGTGPVPLDAAAARASQPIAVRVDAALAFVAKVARAVHRVHVEGVIHRDLKPANLMVTPSLDPVILDFGLARSDDLDLDSLTATGDVFGTPAYMAPELLGDEPRPADQGTDVWALGCILWELLFGRRPFEAPTRSALLEAIRYQPLPPGRRLLPELAPELEAVLEVVLERDPVRRYASAEALAADLERVQRRQPVRARKGSWALRARRFVQRQPLRVAVTALALLLVTVTPTAIAVQAKFAQSEIQAEKQRAERLAGTALDAITDALVELGDSALAELPGEVERRRKVLARAEELLAQLEAEPELQPTATAQLIRIHYELGKLGDGARRNSDAARHMTRVIELLERHPDLPLGRYSRRHTELTARTWLATALMRQGKTAAAHDAIETARKQPSLWNDAFSRTSLVFRQAVHAGLARDWEASARHATDALSQLEAVDPASLANPSQLDDLRTDCWLVQGQALHQARQHAAAVVAFDRALAAITATTPARLAFSSRLQLAEALQGRALVLQNIERVPEALTDIDRAIAIGHDLRSLVPGQPDYRFVEAQARVFRVRILQRSGAHEAALAEVRSALTAVTESAHELARSPYLSRGVVGLLNSLANVTRAVRSHEDPLRAEILAAGCEFGFAAMARSPTHAMLAAQLSPVARGHASFRRVAQDYEGGAATLARMARIHETAVGDATDIVKASERFSVLRGLAFHQAQLHHFAASHASATRALEFANRAVAEEPASKVTDQAPFRALTHQLEAAFELGYRDEILAACDDPMRHFIPYLARCESKEGPRRCLSHPLYSRSDRFLAGSPPNAPFLGLRLATALADLHRQVAQLPGVKGRRWQRTLDRLRARSLHLMAVAGSELLRGDG